MTTKHSREALTIPSSWGLSIYVSIPFLISGNRGRERGISMWGLVPIKGKPLYFICLLIYNIKIIIL